MPKWTRIFCYKIRKLLRSTKFSHGMRSDVCILTRLFRGWRLIVGNKITKSILCINLNVGLWFGKVLQHVLKTNPRTIICYKGNECRLYFEDVIERTYLAICTESTVISAAWKVILLFTQIFLSFLDPAKTSVSGV